MQRYKELALSKVHGYYILYGYYIDIDILFLYIY